MYYHNLYHDIFDALIRHYCRNACLWRRLIYKLLRGIAVLRVWKYIPTPTTISYWFPRYFQPKVALVECVIIFNMGHRFHCWKAVDGALVISFAGDCLFLVSFFGCLIIIWWSPVGLFLIYPSFYKENSRSLVWFGSWQRI